MKFTNTRARKCDPQTSKDAAKVAAMDKSTRIRKTLRTAIREYEQDGLRGWTAKELSAKWRIQLADVYRRLPEVSGIKRHQSFRREGCSVWIAS